MPEMFVRCSHTATNKHGGQYTCDLPEGHQYERHIHVCCPGENPPYILWDWVVAWRSLRVRFVRPDEYCRVYAEAVATWQQGQVMSG